MRGASRLRGSGDAVAKAVHLAELVTGILFFLIFGLSILSAVTSLFILPPVSGDSQASDAYSAYRTAVLRWQLVAQKAVEVVVVFVPEVLDRHLTRKAEEEDHGRPSKIGQPPPGGDAG